MVRFAARWFLLIFPGVFAASAFAQTAAPHVEPASHRAAHASPFAPLPQQLFGAIPLSTRSEEARKTLELAWDKYENAMYQPSAQLARQAAKKDPHSALIYALVSFAARRGMPDAAALAKAKALPSRPAAGIRSAAMGALCKLRPPRPVSGTTSAIPARRWAL